MANKWALWECGDGDLLPVVIEGNDLDRDRRAGVRNLDPRYLAIREKDPKGYGENHLVMH